MTALAQEKARRQETWKLRAFTLKVGTKGYKGARAALDLATGKVVPATSATNLLPIGVFAETIDATSAAAPITVDLEREIQLEWFANATAGAAIAATDVGNLAYMVDDQTVGITPTGSVAGRIWAYDATKGIAIEKLSQGKAPLSQPTIGSYTANDYAPATVENESVNDVPTTGAASTITLPAAALDGTRMHWAADGTKNGHTVQYRDATGPTNLTTALTASKRHLVIAVKLGGKWFANAYVSP